MTQSRLQNISFYPKRLSGAVLLLPFAMLLLFSFSIMTQGVPGFKVDKTQHGLKVSSVLRSDGPVKPGDVIVEISGVPYHELLNPWFFFTCKDIENETIVVLRQGESLSIRPELKWISPFRYIAQALPQLLFIGVLVCLGIVTLLRAPSNQPIALFLTAISMISATFAATLPSSFGLLHPATISISFVVLTLCNWFGFGALFHFVLSFPESRNVISRKNWLPAVIYIGIPLISLLPALWFNQGGDEFWGWLQRFRNIGLPVVFLLIFIKHLLDYRAIKSTIEKNRIRIIIAAYWFSFGPYMLLYALPNIIFNQPLISFKLVSFTSLSLPVAYFAALIRYRLFDVDRMISRTVAFFSLTFLLTVIYSYLVIYLKRTFLNDRLFSEEFFFIYIISVALLFGPMFNFISRAFDVWFIPRRLYSKGLLWSLTQEIGSTVRVKKLEKLLTINLLENIHIQKVMLVIFEEDSLRICPDGVLQERITVSAQNLKNSFADDTAYSFCDGYASDRQLRAFQFFLSRHGFEMIFPLRGGTGIRGLLVIGRRNDEKTYSKRDLQFLSTIATQAGLALENSLHYESLVKSKQQIEEMFEQIARKEKLAALGEMSTVLAHELKNPLGIIRSSAQYLQTHEKDVENREELLEFIIGETDGLETAINNMMGLARYKEPVFAPTDLSESIEKLIQLWGSSGNHNRDVAIRFQAERRPFVIQADFQQLQQVLLNCMANSEDAMPEGGQIDISLGEVNPGSATITIRDTGTGIPESQIHHVFEKFHTTKEKGLGIGLSVCQQIVGSHNGYIWLKNQEEGGLVIRIELPENPEENLPLEGLVHQFKEGWIGG